MTKSRAVEPRPVYAIGAAGGGSQGVSGKAIESAMAEAIEGARQEANAIMEKHDLSDKKKQEMAAKIMAPEEIRRRMMAARKAVTGGN